MNGPASPPKDDSTIRSQLLKRVEALHPVLAPDGAQFVAGARLRLRRGVDREAALRTVAELEAIGASAEVEANRPPDEAILSLDQFQDGGTEPAPAIAGAPAIAAPAVAVDDSRFRPTADWQPMRLELERPAPPPLMTRATPLAPTLAFDDDDRERAAPVAVDEPWQPVPGRIAGGALRNNPPVRIAVGVVLGLALGWMFAQPYAHHAERRVAALRAQADAERYRPVDEAQARVRALDRDADDAASSGAIGMALIWVLVGGAAFAGWWRLT